MIETCTEYQSQIDAYVDGMLSGSDESALLAHIQICDKCKQQLALSELLKDTLPALEESPPRALSSLVMAKIAELETAKRKRSWTRPFIMSAACAVFLFLIFGSGNIMQYLVPAQSDTLTEISSMPALTPYTDTGESDASVQEESFDEYVEPSAGAGNSTEAANSKIPKFHIPIGGLNALLTRPGISIFGGAAGSAFVSPSKIKEDYLVPGSLTDFSDLPEDMNIFEASAAESPSAAPEDAKNNDPAVSQNAYGLVIDQITEKPTVTIDGTFQCIAHATLAESLPEALAAYRVERVAKIHYLIIPASEFQGVLGSLQSLPIHVYIYTGATAEEKNATQVLFMVTIE